MKATLLAGALALSLPLAAAHAQEKKPDRRVRIGLGAKLSPEFPGSDRARVGPLVRVSIADGDEPFRFGAADDNFGIALIRTETLRVGPTLKLQGARRERDAGTRIGRVGSTVELGGFAELYPSEGFRLRSELRKGVNGHEGLVGQLAADKIWRDGDKYLISLGPRLGFSDGRYSRAYFGVSPQAAVLTGLSAYRPGAGVHSLGAASGFHASLGGAFGVLGYAQAERLVGDAGKSPFIRRFGSRNQFSGGLGLSYTFGMKR